MKKTIFQVIGVVVGIILFFFLRNFLSAAVQSIGIVTYIDFGEMICTTKYAYEDCSYGTGTDISVGLGAISSLVAYAVGNTIYNRSLFPRTKQQKLTFFTAFVCLLLWTSISIVILLIVDKAGVYINFVIGALIAYGGYKFHENQADDY
jgi:hypothetical protein